MQSRFQTARLLLRPVELRDADDIQRLAGEYQVAKTTLSLPHPYPEGAAETWIHFRTDAARHGHGYTFAIINLATKALMGCISLDLTSEHQRAEIGYWLGSRFWENGYATEAAQQVVRFGFQQLRLNRIWGAVMTKNQASSAVLRKIGMTFEGCFKQHVRKWSHFEDIDYYGMTTSDFHSIEAPM
ncbi:GNAT family N-acetyltransferase [Paenibacillus rhizovicinus]|uniref:GNAT family N-acetyltransferase n=1 Tax=Paenibacillus rhizovicinus TaxID=2704463 RepID=A0A6C0P1H0_9BACL|nr:GNAT family N-acetyltransferase [Paenibacillus rhizovicinus]QHW30572.1 GNAT family N-acetyltransferase [Paenibacillus rhizovicinus]